MRLSSFSCLAGLALAACSKSNESAAPAPSASVARVAAPAAPSASAATPANTGSDWTGHYTATPGPFTVPDGGEWAGVKFRGEDASVGLGDGTLTVSVAPNGHAQGTLDGPLGPLRVTGELADAELTLALVSGDPGHGFSGTAVGKEEEKRIAGTMHLSLPTGNVIREAAFTLERKR